VSAKTDYVETGEERRATIMRDRALALEQSLAKVRAAVKRRLGITIDTARLDEGEVNELWGLG